MGRELWNTSNGARNVMMDFLVGGQLPEVFEPKHWAPLLPV